MKIVAFIPARGGSKGINGKNMKKVNGVRLIDRSIITAKSSRYVEAVFVSTDSRDIAKSAERLGAFVVIRPDEIAGDEASSESAIEHFLGQFPSVEIVVFIQATSPFVDPAQLDAAIEMVDRRVADSVFSAYKTHSFRWRLKGKKVEPAGHSSVQRQRRQDIQAEYIESGAFYILRRTVFDEYHSRFCGAVSFVEVDSRFAVEIDHQEDLELANHLASLWVEKPKVENLDAVVVDFDGVQTNNYAHIDSTGNESVQISRADGLGIAMLKEMGVKILFLSTEENSVVGARARKLEVECLQKVGDKAETLRSWAEKNNVNLLRSAFIGNDVNDEKAMRLVGTPVAVFDAHPTILRLSSIVLNSVGGAGAIREFAGIVAPSSEKAH